MTRLAVEYPDVERRVVDYLTGYFADLGEVCTVSVGVVPDGWVPTDTPHLQVSSDGAPLAQHPFVMTSTVRLVGWAHTTTEAKRLAQRAQGCVLHNRENAFTFCQFLTGVLPTRDPVSHAEIAFTTTRVSVRSVPIEPLGS